MLRKAKYKNENSKQIAECLLQINAIKLSPQNPFTWASGIISPIYCDNRISLSYPIARNLILQGFVHLSNAFESIDCIAGVATAGIPHGSLLAHALGLPFVYVRSQSKKHGRQNQIEGFLEPGSRVLVIEDLISTGGSALQAVDVLEANGADIVGIIAIFTYGFDEAEAAFAKRNIKCKTLTDYDVLLEAGIESGSIKEKDLATLANWRRHPAEWGNTRPVN